ncbi:MAG: YkgJ family cysteine cluster protein [Anaerolineales bacterium]|nr:YkgJ family cysteine cluster protein [Anaerolineales bacterium]
MGITTDLERIKGMAKERDDENWKFRAFLKQMDMTTKEVDAMVHAITDKVTSQIDCTECANCCKQSRPVLDKDDISKFALGLTVTVPEFQKQYLSQDEENSSKHVFNKRPCPFLKNDQCSNYDCRPKDCRSYPHLYKKDFTSRLLGVVANYEVCPIVFNVYEQLKIKLWHNNRLNDADFEWE